VSGTWASTSVDLHLDLAGSRIRESLERALRDAARTGRLAPGVQLPSSRALAADLGLARNTVTDAYGQLIAEGWLTARPGAGTYVAAAAGLSVTTVPVDAHGAMIDQLAGVDAVLLTPAHQFPLGVALAPQRRSQVVAWAGATGGLIIEDDYDGEFRYDRQPVGAVQALAPERVAYGGTVSKTLAPGLRLGWLALPAALVPDVVAVKTLTDRHTSSLDQLTLAEFVSSGHYDRQVRRSRLAYRSRRDRLVDALRHIFGDAALVLSDIFVRVDDSDQVAPDLLASPPDIRTVDIIAVK